MKKLFLFAVVLMASVHAETINLSRAAAFELHSALTQLSGGLSPDNTLIAADNINALESAAKSYRTGYAKLLQLQQSAVTPEQIDAFKSADAKFAAAAEELKAFDLVRLTVTKDEIKDSKLAPLQLAVLRRYLGAPAPQLASTSVLTPATNSK